MSSCFPYSLNSRPSRSGFTLIEISMVLVIIALMFSVVLVGKTMLETLKYRKIAAEAQEIKTGMSVFEQRFGAYPGDLKNTSLLTDGGTICGPVAGDNNGIVGSYADNWTEPAQAICQLGNEGLISPQTSGLTGGWMSPMGAFLPSKAYGVIKTDGSNYPTLEYYVYYNPAYAVPFDATGAPYVVGVVGGAGVTSGACAAGGLTSYEAFMLDRKIDDGLPRAGSIRATLTLDCYWYGICATPCMPVAYNVTAYQNTTDNVNKTCISAFLPDK